MKLILSSDVSFLMKYGYDLTGIPKDQMRIGYVTTAIKGARKKTFFDNVKKIIIDNGYKLNDIDIESKTKEEIIEFFQDKNIVHIEGGNTFYLLKVALDVGFLEILKEFINQGKIIIGMSAGAYIMCPTIEVADWDETGKPRFDMTDFSSFGLVPFLLKVHYKDTQEEKIREKMKSLKYPLRILRDGQGILVEDNNYNFIGDGEEVILS